MTQTADEEDGDYLKREHVPEDKEWRPSTRENSDYKWQTQFVVGALEVDCMPDLNLGGPMTPHNSVALRAPRFEEAQAAFKECGLRESFVEEAETFPFVKCCCGLIRDDPKTIKRLGPHMNETWVEDANKKLKDKGFKVDCFVWSWNNISGASETIVLLIRFHALLES
eukprot:CAMPEP_0119013604 /NCGR_PEP_ID=MMETSP1176-20130426/8561_1 /TAXON_ID=265551 /ORGANISM="Synedropsis recta cf, Strain CCMP1620" /LENGTH=167 /DNA_ID=CAMNT_0006966707 /DNA_START=99 /DNA_END=602 /DNA_ORIENTATION=+